MTICKSLAMKVRSVLEAESEGEAGENVGNKIVQENHSEWSEPVRIVKKVFIVNTSFNLHDSECLLTIYPISLHTML